MRDVRDESSATWSAKPAYAVAVRVFIALAPLAASILASRIAAPRLWRPDGMVGLVVYIAQLAAVGISVAIATDRVVRKLLPLTTLLNLTLVFPDHAPSRFGVALRAGSLKRLTREAGSVNHTLSADHQTAAEELLTMVTALSGHERMTVGHTERVRAYCDLIGKQLGLSDRERGLLGWSALIHDIGKLQVPADILALPGRPSDDQWQVLSAHPTAGATMVEPLADWLGPWRLSARDHHEQWDGSGYPSGASGDDISLAGRIVAVADAYDVITSTRSYKQAQSRQEARQELVRCAGTQFDPDVVRALLNASLTDRRVGVGMFGWLVELPSLSSFTSGVGQTVATTATAATVTVGSVAVGPWAPLTTNPEQAYEIDAAALSQTGNDALAFADVEPIEDPAGSDDSPSDPADSSEAEQPTGTEPARLDGPSEADTGDPADALQTDDGQSEADPPADPTPSTLPPGDDTDTTQQTTATTTAADRRTTTTSRSGTVAPSTTRRTTTTTRQATSRPTTVSTSSPTTTPTTAPPTTAAPTTTAQPTTTTTAVPTTTTTAPPSTVFNLDSDGRTRSHWILSLDDAPDTGPLANYDTDRDDDPGLTVKRGDGLSEWDNTKRQRWSIYYGDRTLTGTPTLTIWVATKSFSVGRQGTFEIGLSRCHLLDCDELGAATATFNQSSFGNDFGQVTVELPPVDHYFQWYHYLVLTVAPTEASEKDLWFAYDNTTYPSRLTID